MTAYAMSAARQVGDDLVIASGPDTLTLANVQRSQLHPDDFSFV